MEIKKLQRTTVERLRKVKSEQGLSVSNIMEMLDAKGYFVSEATVKRVFSEAHDPLSFRYRDTVAPLADVLLDLYDDSSDSEDVAALKAMIHDKNKMIDMLFIKNEEQKADYERRITHLKSQVARLEKNLDFRETVVSRKDEVIEHLLLNIEHKDRIIEELLKKE